jgi:hypothetical protein
MNFVVALILAAVLVYLPLRPPPEPVVTVAPAITYPATRATVGSDELQSLKGTADPGVTLRFFDGDQLLGETVAGGDGQFTFDLSAPLETGPHTLQAVVIDSDGRQVVSSVLVPFTVVPPPAPDALLRITRPEDGASFAADHLLTVEGSGQSGSTVQLYEGETLLGQAETGEDGRWAVHLAEPLSAGEHALRAVALDEEDHRGPSSGLITVRFGEAVVAPPVFSPGEGTTFAADDLLVLQGAAEPGSRVRVYDADAVLGEATADADGLWRVELAEALALGPHAVQAVIVDESESEVAPSEVWEFTIEEVLPPPVIVAPGRGSTFAAGEPALLEGTGPAGATIRLYDSTMLLGEVQAGEDGHWALSLAEPLDGGVHTLQAVVLDREGQEGAASEVHAIMVEEEVVAPVVTVPVSGATIGAAAALPIRGTASPGATVHVYDGRGLLGETQADGEGNWIFDLPQPLSVGEHTLRAAVLDALGQEVGSSQVVTISIVELPSELAIVLPASGQLAAGGLVEGIAQPGTIVQVFDGDALLVELTPDADGYWSILLPQDLSLGQHTLWLAAVDTDGTLLAQSERVLVEIVETTP